MRWLLASIISCVSFCAVALGTFLPLRDATGVQYLFVWPGALKLLAASAAAGAALILLYVIVVRRARRYAPESLEYAQSGHWLAGAAALGVVCLGVLPAAPGVGEPAAVIGYFFYDLRWWWLGAVMVWLAFRAERLTGEPIGRRLRTIESWSPPARLLLFDSVLFLGVTLSAAASTRYLRFDPGLHGDEPKYIRYCEVWYQGGAFEVSGKRPFSEMPLDADSGVLRIVPLLLRSIGEETRTLSADIGAFLADPHGFQWNRATRVEGFVIGKRGGKYQIYQPGLSVFLFPGYYLDRHVLALRATNAGEFPAELVLSNMTLLFLYGFCAVALFRLLRHALSSEALAFFWAAVAMLSLPTAAFAFQFYPETPALLVIILVITYVCFHASGSDWRQAAAAGAGAAGLAWFHPRFLLVSAILTTAGTITTRSRTARYAFTASAAVVYVSVMAVAYRITGSWMPTALWDAPGGESTLNLAAAPLTVLGYALHRLWGIAPHAPVLLAVVPGLAVLARQSIARATLLLVVGLALAIPAAAHTLNAAGSTPGRLIVAIVPLLIWPVAVLVRRFWSMPAMRTPTIVAVILSLETGISYNWNHIKIMGTIRTTGVSGWRPNLAFPFVSGGGWNESSWNVTLLLLILASLILASIAAFLRAAPSRNRGARPTRWRAPRLGSGRAGPAATFALVVLLSGAATAFNGNWTTWEYFLDDVEARQKAAAALVELDQCRVCFATRNRAIDWRWLEPNTSEQVNVETSVDALMATVHVVLNGPDGPLRFGRIRTDFGDGSDTPWTGIVGDRELSHRYKQPGTYSIVVWLQLRNGEMRADRRTLVITGSR